jgi:signal transduction histidine kinase
LGLAVVVLAELGPAASALAQYGHKQVLVLYSTRRDSEFSAVGEAELPRMLDIGLGRDLDYYSDFFDLTRSPNPDYQSAFGDFLRQKYRGLRFDLVIALQDAAVEFVDRNRDGLFAGTPEVFLSNDPAKLGGPNSTGLILERNFAATLTFVEQLQPDVKNIFVVTGAASADKDYERLARIQFRPFEPRFTFTYLSGLETGALERRLSSLPARAAVYYLLVTEDGAGDKFHPLEYIDRVAAAANAPTYCWVDSAIGHGVVGGNLYSQKAVLERVGQIALRVLGGERAEDISVAAVDVNAPQVDWRQLKQWGISEARVPAGTLVSFREPNVWDRYRFYILGASTLLLVQSGLIAGLLIQRVRRQYAETELVRSQTQLRTSYDRIHDLGARLLSAQEVERSRIARELHDDISQQLALLTMDLEGLDGPDRNENEKLAGDALARARDVSKSVRDLSHRLHPARLRLIGLVAALHALRLELSHSGIAIALAHDNVPSTLPPDLMLCLFRVVQEALQNAVKYSGAREVSVQLAGGPDGLLLSIVDNGAGFDVDAAWGKGLGLLSMSERVEAIGGTLEIRSSSAGTRLQVTIPAHVVHGADLPAKSAEQKLKRVAGHGDKRRIG